jgi:hypothetical protein
MRGGGKGSDADGDENPLAQFHPFLMGECAAVVNEIKPAKEVVMEFVHDAIKHIEAGSNMIAKL